MVWRQRVAYLAVQERVEAAWRKWGSASHSHEMGGSLGCCGDRFYSGKQVFKDTYGDAVRHHRRGRVVYDGPAAARSPSMPSCEPPGACVAQRRKVYQAFQEAHAPRFDKTAQPECPTRHTELVPAYFTGWVELDLDTLKVAPSSLVSCASDPSQM